MLRRATTASVLVVLLGACAPETPSGAPPAASADAQVTVGEQLNAWFDEKFEEQLQQSPIQLTFLGRKDRHDQMDCGTLACAEERVGWMQAATEELKTSFDRTQLSPEDRDSFDLWVYQSDKQVRGFEFRDNGLVFDQMTAIHTFLPTFLMQFHAVDDEADARAYVSRIRESARFLNELLDIARMRADKGVHAPRFAYEAVIDEARKILAGAPFGEGPDSDLLADFKGKVETLVASGAMTAEAAVELIAEAEEALRGEFQGAYAALIAFAAADLANSPDPAGPQGVSTQPNGVAFYDFLLSEQTTTTLTASEIHDIGLREVARLRGEMEAIREQVGFEGTLEEFFALMRDAKDDPRFYYPNTDAGRQAYIDDAAAAIDRIKAVLPEYFGLLPKADLVVRRVESFREQAGAAQHYFPGTPDGSRPGVYYVHLLDMTAMPKMELEVVAYHEGLPGHHMQISIAQELTGVPQFRTQTRFTAYVEGWALYAERLAKEMPGTYEDPYSDFGRLGAEIWRAIRLVLDTGLHAKGWTEEQAVEYFLANAPVTELQARSEVQRYIVMPAQATSYLIGMLEILEMRERAQRALGERFDIRAFHDTLLDGGALPLPMLNARVDRWIAEAEGA